MEKVQLLVEGRDVGELRASVWEDTDDLGNAVRGLTTVHCSLEVPPELRAEVLMNVRSLALRREDSTVWRLTVPDLSFGSGDPTWVQGHLSAPPRCESTAGSVGPRCCRPTGHTGPHLDRPLVAVDLRPGETVNPVLGW